MMENPTHGGPDSKGAWPRLGLAAGFGCFGTATPPREQHLHRQTKSAVPGGWGVMCSLKSDAPGTQVIRKVACVSCE